MSRENFIIIFFKYHTFGMNCSEAPQGRGEEVASEQKFVLLLFTKKKGSTRECFASFGAQHKSVLHFIFA